MSNQRNELLKVELRVYKSLLEYSSQAADYFVAVTGTGLQLGYDNINKAPRCKRVRNNLWVKEVWLPRESNIHFKFLVVKAANNVTVDVENISHRHLFVGKRAVEVDARYNQNGLVTKEDGPQQRKPMGRKVNKGRKMKRVETETPKITKVKDKSLKNKSLEDESLKIKSLEDESLKIKSLKDESLKIKSLNDESLKIKSLEDESLKIKSLENESLNIKSLEDESLKIKSLEDESLKIKSLKDESLKIKSLEDRSLKIKSLEYENLKVKTEEGKSLKIKELEDEISKMKLLEQESLRSTKLEDNTEIAPLHHNTDNTGDTSDKSTFIMGFPFNGKRCLLAAAGVAVISCVGYFAFR